MTIEYVDHVAVGKGRVVSYFKDKENLLNLLGILLEKMDDLEVSLTSLSGIKDLSSVTGIWLDYLGRIVGVDRDGLTDEFYRAEIYLKIAINNSDGTAPVIQEIIRTYTNSDYVRLGSGIMSYGQMIFNGTDNANKPLYTLMQDLSPVTTFILTSQNTNNICYMPSWETEVAELEPFYVVDEFGTEELFEVTLSTDTDPVQFFVQTGQTSSFDADTPSDVLVEWEESEPTTLNFTTYDYLELLISGSPSTENNGGVQIGDFIIHSEDVWYNENDEPVFDLITITTGLNVNHVTHPELYAIYTSIDPIANETGSDVPYKVVADYTGDYVYSSEEPVVSPLLLKNTEWTSDSSTPFLWEIDDATNLVDGYEQWLVDLLDVYTDIDTIEELFVLLSQIHPNLPDA